MADEDSDFLVCFFDLVLQLIGKHHLRQFAVTISAVLVIALVPVHVVELHCLETHLITKTCNDRDAAFGFFDPIEKHAAQDEVAVVVCAQLTFKTVYGEFL